MLQAPAFDGLPFDPFSFQQDGLTTSSEQYVRSGASFNSHDPYDRDQIAVHHVRSGSKAEVGNQVRDVRFTPESGSQTYADLQCQWADGY